MARTPLMGYRKSYYSSIPPEEDGPPPSPGQKRCKIIQIVIVTTVISFFLMAILLWRSQCHSSSSDDSDEDEYVSESGKNHLKIIGGTQARDDTEFPFALKMFNNGEFKCGAVIVGESIGLTAAHCVSDEPNPAGYTLRAGKIRDRNKQVEEGQEEAEEEEDEVRQVTKIVIHPNNEPETIDYDMAIFQVDPPFQFNSRVNKINLPTTPTQFSEEEDLPGKQFTAIGWGLMGGWVYADVLQKVKIPYVPRAVCRNEANIRNITETMICAGVPASNKASCFGDSGGPLILEEGLSNRNIKGPLLIGLTSWSHFCGTFSPGVYANVRFLSTWIHEQASILVANGTVITTTTSEPPTTSATTTMTPPTKRPKRRPRWCSWFKWW